MRVNRRRALIMNKKYLITVTKTVKITEHYDGGEDAIIGSPAEYWGALLESTSATLDLGVSSDKIKSISVSPTSYTYTYEYKGISVTATYGISINGSVATISHPEVISGYRPTSSSHRDTGSRNVTLTVTYTFEAAHSRISTGTKVIGFSPLCYGDLDLQGTSAIGAGINQGSSQLVSFAADLPAGAEFISASVSPSNVSYTYERGGHSYTATTPLSVVVSGLNFAVSWEAVHVGGANPYDRNNSQSPRSATITYLYREYY